MHSLVPVALRGDLSYGDIVMEMVSITEGMTMSNISFDSVSNSAPANALQGVGTNALVDNPFTFEPVAEATSAHALQGVGTNALVDNPFSFQS